MESTALPVSFKVLLASLPRGEPLSTAALQARGLSAFRASALARSGWLTHLARGVYMLPGDTLTRDGSLAFLTVQTPGLHVGSQKALAWRGVCQNIALREHLHLWGDTPRRLPEWFTQRFPAGYQATQLFDDALPKAFGLQFHPEVTHAMMCRWTVRAAHRLELPGAQDRSRQIEGRFMYDPHVASWLDSFLDHWLGEKKLAPPRKTRRAVRTNPWAGLRADFS